MADPFETRLEFSEMLARLNASQASVLKCVLFAHKYANPQETSVDMKDILFDAVLEEMRVVTKDGGYINKRINLFCFLDGLIKDNQLYVHLVKQHIQDILSLVLPDEVPLAVHLNAQPVLKILTNWAFISSQQIQHVKDQFDVARQKLRVENKKVMSKEETQRRIEHDRERHKIAKEEVWTTLSQENTDTKEQEFAAIWNAIGEFDEQDSLQAYNEKYLLA